MATISGLFNAAIFLEYLLLIIHTSLFPSLEESPLVNFLNDKWLFLALLLFDAECLISAVEYNIFAGDRMRSPVLKPLIASMATLVYRYANLDRTLLLH